MSSLAQRIRWFVAIERFTQYAAVKGLITLSSIIAFWAMSEAKVDVFYATTLNSIAAQASEFFMLRNHVFKDRLNGRLSTTQQTARFWVFNIFMAGIEGLILVFLKRQFGLIGLPAYGLGHIPTIFLRYWGESKLVFPKNKTPSSY